MIALVPVRDGVLPSGTREVIAECGARVMLMGSGTESVDVTDVAEEVHLIELGPFAPAGWTAALVPILADVDGTDILVLPHSPDGRDLAPHLALALDRPLLAGAVAVTPSRARLARRGGLDLHDQRPAGAFVATLLPGARGPQPIDGPTTTHRIDTARPDGGDNDNDRDGDNDRGNGNGARTATGPAPRDAHIVEVLPPDVRTMDLSEATRITGGGAGLESAERFAELDRFSGAIGAVMGATRVITDRGWVHHDRQIGTTGVVVDPTLYISFGVSGAVQHTSGLGRPDHIISVNTDPHCPMMAMSDLAVVSDANATLDELLALVAPDETTHGHG